MRRWSRMANKYANLIGTNKIKDEYSKINTGFDQVEADINDVNSRITVLANQKGQPEGIATLDSSGKVPLEQLPEGMGSGSGVDVFARQEIANLANQKGQPEGIATLDSDGKVPVSQLPDELDGVDEEARQAIAQLESQYNDIANQVNSAPKFVRVDEYPLEPEEGVIYFKVILPNDPEDPEDPEEPEDPNIVKFYTEGVENVEWVEAYSTGDETYGTQSKESDHLYIEIFDKVGSTVNRTYATKDPVDVTSLKQIEIYFRTSETVSAAIRFGVAVARDTNNSSSSYVVTANPSAKPNGYTSILDVSELTGEYYIRVCLMNANANISRPGQLRVYNVRGIKDV